MKSTHAQKLRRVTWFAVAALFLSTSLSPFPLAADAAESPEEIKKLVEQLGSPQWKAREDATEELKKIGLAARPALNEALRSDDFEVRSRAEQILSELSWSVEGDSAQVIRLLQGYGKASISTRFQIIYRLASLDVKESFPALLRIVQNDADETVAFVAVAALKEHPETWRLIVNPPLDAQRPSALSLLAWAQTKAKQPQAIATMEKAIAQERARLAAATEITDNAKQFLADMTLTLAKRLKDAGRNDESEKTFRLLTEMAPDTLDGALEFLDELLLAQRPQEIAVTVAKLNPDLQQQPRILYLLAAAHEAQKKNADAQAVLKRALEAGENVAERHFETGEFLFSHNWHEWAEREYEKILELEKKRLADIAKELQGEEKRFLSYTMISWTVKFRKAGRTAMAEKILRDLMEISPDTPEAVAAYFASLLEAQRSDQIIAAHAKLKLEVKDDARVLFLLAAAHKAAGDKKTADETATRAMGVCGNDANALWVAGETLREVGLEDWASRAFEKILKLQERNVTMEANAHLRLASIKERRHEFLKAAEHLDQALIIVRTEEAGALMGGSEQDLEARSLVLRIQHYRENGEHQKLERALDTLLTQHPHHVEATIEIYKLLVSEQRQQEAVKRVEDVRSRLLERIQNNPGDADSHNELAWILACTNQRLEEAQQFSEKSLLLEPENFAYLDTLAEIMFRRGQIAKAIELGNRALKLKPNDVYLTGQLKRFQTEKPPQ